MAAQKLYVGYLRFFFFFFLPPHNLCDLADPYFNFLQ